MLRQSTAVIALLGMNGALLAQPAWSQTSAAPAPAAQAPAAQAPAEQASCPAPKIAGDKMDLTQVPGTNLVTVPVQINGAPKQFLLDIGTDPDSVAQTTVADLHLQHFNQTIATDAMAGQNTPFSFNASVVDVKSARAEDDRNNKDYVRVASFSVAGATAQNLEMPVANDRDMGTSERYDGVFTASLFAQYDLDFDFGARKLSFVDPVSCTEPNQVAFWPHQVVAVIPIAIENGKMTVPVTIQGHVIKAVVDMGSDHTVMRRDVAQDMLGVASKDMTSDGGREDGMGMQIYVHTFPQISFGGVTAVNVPARIQANSMVHPINRAPVLGSRATFASAGTPRIADLALGMDVLHQLHIYAAFSQNKLYVTPAE